MDLKAVACFLAALALMGGISKADKLGKRYLEIKAKEIDFNYVQEERKYMEAQHQLYLNCMAHPTWNKKQKAKNCYDKSN